MAKEAKPEPQPTRVVEIITKPAVVGEILGQVPTSRNPPPPPPKKSE